MEVYETEEQQLKALKDWWNENGTSIIVGIVLGVGGYFGYQFWQSQSAEINQQASGLYSELLKIDATDKADEFSAAAESLKTEFADSSYAILAALHLAKSAADKDDFATAETQLRWAAEKATGLDVQPIINVRLARVLNAQQKHDEAIALLNGIKGDSFKGLAQQVLGDSYLAKGDKEQARMAYETAKESTESFAAKNELDLLVNDLQSAPVVQASVSDAPAATPTQESSSTEAQEASPESADSEKEQTDKQGS